MVGDNNSMWLIALNCTGQEDRGKADLKCSWRARRIRPLVIKHYITEEVTAKEKINKGEDQPG